VWTKILTSLPLALLLAVGGGCGGGGLATEAVNSGPRTRVDHVHPRGAAPRGEGAAAPPGSHRAVHATCDPTRIRVEVATDRDSYRVGQTVEITVKASNESRSVCYVPTGSCLPQMLITSSDGVVVWNRAELRVACNYGRWHRLRPAGSTARLLTWNGEFCAGRTPRSCPGKPVSPGVYRARATWSSLRAGSKRFVVRR
jgi:hypothetical protein